MAFARYSHKPVNLADTALKMRPRWAIYPPSSNPPQENQLSSFQSPDLQERRNNAAAVKKAMLEKFRAASQDPAVAQHSANRVAVNEAREGRMAEREAAKKLREAELAEQAARAAERAAQAQREIEQAEALIAAEAAERELALAVEQKAERDARYAARKAAKKVRRRGY
jgi:hypothetical protein